MKLLFRSFLLSLNLGVVVSILLLFIFTVVLSIPNSSMNKSTFFVIGTVPFLAFWHQHTIFYRKWKHLADLVEKYVFMDLNSPVSNNQLGELEESELKLLTARKENFDQVVRDIEHTIVIDILHLDLWFHKSFYRYFIQIVLCRMHSLHRDDHKQFIQIAKAFQEGQMKEQDIESLFRTV